jgi:hypothetical protein
MQFAHGRITPLLRSPGFEHSLSDVASWSLERQGRVGSFRRRGEVGSTSTSTNAERRTPNAKRQTPNAKRQTPFPLLNQMNSSGLDGDSSRGDPGRNWVKFIDYDSVRAQRPGFISQWFRGGTKI